MGSFEPGPVADVVLDHPTKEQSYSYLLPLDLAAEVRIGSVVWVPSRNRRAKGWVVGFGDDPRRDLKPILSVAAPFPLLSREQLRVAAAAAEYYLTEMRRFLRRMTPPSVPASAPEVVEGLPSDDPAWGVALLGTLAGELEAEGYETVTSSPQASDGEAPVPAGVLLVRHPPGHPPAEAIGRALRRVSESRASSLTALGSVLTRDARLVRKAITHGQVYVDTAVSARRRTSIWVEACRPGSALTGDRAVVLHRSARLGLVSVVDESSPNHREDRIPYYNARTLCLLRARVEGCPAVLTAPWPSYESRRAATVLASPPRSLRDRLRRVVEIVDRSREVPEPGFISSRSARRIRTTLESGGRVVVFVGKKGDFRSQRCRDCWFILDRKEADACTRCGSRRLKPASPGSAAIESEARRLFPRASIAQLTRESCDFDGSASIVVATEAALWRLGSADLVVVVSVESLVGLVSFDAWFRSARILSDLAGLLASGGQSWYRGALLLQTYNPSHPVVDALASGEESRLLEPDLAARASERLPPFCRAVLVESADDVGRELIDEFARVLSGRSGSERRLQVAGPHTEGGRRRALVLDDGTISLWEEADALRQRAEAAGARVRIEVDPDASYRQF